MAGAPVERRVVAASAAFTALVNTLFICVGAQIPHTNAGVIVCLMGLIGLMNSLYLFQPLLKERSVRKYLVRQLALICGSVILYLAETWQGVLLLRHPTTISPLYTLDGLLMGVFAVGLARSWQLLGVRRYGLLGWLSPLHEEQAPTA